MTSATRSKTGTDAPDINGADINGVGRPPADRFMRRLLRIQGTSPTGSITGTGEKQMGRSIMASAVRCTLTYLVIPIAGPTVGILGSLAVPISLVLCLVAGIFSVRSLRIFWRTDHRFRWAYTAFAGIILVLLTYGVGQDLRTLLAR